MDILFSTSHQDTRRISYHFKEGVVIARSGEHTDTFDFRDFDDGRLDTADINTKLEICPVISAEKNDGKLSIVLDKFIGLDESEEESEWTSHEEIETEEIISESTAHLNWISKEEQEKEQLLPTDKERLEMLEQALLFLTSEE